jgi:hypothetical protein
MYLSLDLDQVEALQYARAKLWVAITAAWDLSVNEKREARGYGAMANADMILVPSSYQPLDVMGGAAE